MAAWQRLLAERQNFAVSEEPVPFVAGQQVAIEFTMAAALTQSIGLLQTVGLLKASTAEMQLVV